MLPHKSNYIESWSYPQRYSERGADKDQNVREIPLDDCKRYRATGLKRNPEYGSAGFVRQNKITEVKNTSFYKASGARGG